MTDPSVISAPPTGAASEPRETGPADRPADPTPTHNPASASERMAAIGTFAMGVGHDMDNLLLPIRARIDVLKSMSLPPQAAECVEAIDTCAEHLLALSRGLRLIVADSAALGRHAGSTDLVQWWADVRPILRNAMPRGMALEHRFADNLPAAMIGRQALTKAVFILVHYAGETLKQRGSGRVWVWAEPGLDENTVCVGVTDNGPGAAFDLPADDRTAPFVCKTLQAASQSGLAQVYAIAQDASGRVEIDATPGQGTTVVLVLPAAAANLARTSVGGLAPNARPRALIALGDQRMRAFVAAMLESHQFEIEYGRPDEDRPAQLWVIDPLCDLVGQIGDFIKLDRRRRVLVLGQLIERINSPQVIEIGPRPTSGTIHRKLRELAGAFPAMRDSPAS